MNFECCIFWLDPPLCVDSNWVIKRINLVLNLYIKSGSPNPSKSFSFMKTFYHFNFCDKSFLYLKQFFLHQFPMDRPRTSETVLLETTYTWVCNLKVLSAVHGRDCTTLWCTYDDSFRSRSSVYIIFLEEFTQGDGNKDELQ